MFYNKIGILLKDVSQFLLKQARPGSGGVINIHSPRNYICGHIRSKTMYPHPQALHSESSPTNPLHNFRKSE